MQAQSTFSASGILFKYNEHGSIAYKTSINSKKFIVFLDGMEGNILSIPYFNKLKAFCDLKEIVLVYPQLRSHPNYQNHLIDQDIEDINSLVNILDGQIILIGSSTGCQDCLLYAQSGKSEKIKGIVLQAPVSDVEGNRDPLRQEQIKKARSSGDKYYTYQGKTWLVQRFLTALQQRNKEDLFSTYLQDECFQKWKKYGPILSVLSLRDQYILQDLSHKFKFMGKVKTLAEGDHLITKSQVQEQFIQAVNLFLIQIGFID